MSHVAGYTNTECDWRGCEGGNREMEKLEKSRDLPPRVLERELCLQSPEKSPVFPLFKDGGSGYRLLICYYSVQYRLPDCQTASTIQKVLS